MRTKAAGERQRAAGISGVGPAERWWRKVFCSLCEVRDLFACWQPDRTVRIYDAMHGGTAKLVSIWHVDTMVVELARTGERRPCAEYYQVTNASFDEAEFVRQIDRATQRRRELDLNNKRRREKRADQRQQAA